MKHTIILLAALLALGTKPLFAQQTVVPSAVRTAVTSGQTITPTATQNYIRTETYREGSSPSMSNPSHINVDIQYFDGLGRPIETVQVMASPTGKDIVTRQTYDAFGRADTSYLPYASSSAVGAFVPKTSFTTAQRAFLSTNYDLTVSTDNQFGYSRPVYEASPLNRILKQGAPGADWQPSAHPVQYGYETNTAALPLWKYTGDTYAPVTYPAKSLYVNTVTDEDGKVSKTYTDKQGKVVMKEVVNGSELLQTRYCYDDFELLRCVLQPMAANPTQIEYCFFYKYDSRKRMIEKKVPGSGWVYLVYDARDRLVFTSDGNLRAVSSSTTWYYTRYDDFNRPIEHGKMKTNVAVSHQDLQAHFVDKIAMYTENGATYAKVDLLAYDKYPSTEPFLGLAFSDNTLVVDKKATSTMGLQTGKWHILFDENNSISGMTEAELYYYDKYGRVIQVVKKNFRGFIERVSNAYNFAGQVVQTRTEHLVSGNNTVVDTYYTYDHRGRLLNISMQVTRPSGSIPSTIVSANVYNEAGLLATKYLHSQNNQAFLQKIDYKYNIRGWLTQINETASLSEGDKFGMKIGYNRLPTSTGSVYYNGNISGIQWSSPIKANIGYRFSYDGANRLTSSSFNEAGTGTMKYYTNYMYDKNGNLTNLVRMNGTITTIDALSYGYLSNSNQLKYANDSYMGGFPGTNSTAQNFVYDANGNVTRDSYRNATISYNQFNLPYLFDFGDSKRIEYIYNGSGQKAIKVVVNGATPYAYTDYLGQFIYETSGSTRIMKAILTPEGRIVNSGTNAAPVWKWEYNLTDHLGNVRAVVTPGAQAGYADVLQENSYYPFGMKMSELCSSPETNNKILYNGKELQDDFGLNWYDYGARFYDPALGRFHSIDNKAEKYNSTNPYAYALNNPLKYIDPDGNEVYVALQGEAQNKALSIFMSTKQGRAFIGKYAGAGQVIMGQKFEVAGEYAQRGIDLRLRTSSKQTMETRLGTAITYLKNSKSGYKRLRDVRVGDLPSERHKYETIIDLRAGETSENAAYTLGHEAFVHADNDAQKLIETHDKGEAAKYSSLGDFVKDINKADLDAGQEHSDLKNNQIQTIIDYVKSLGLNEKTDYYKNRYEKDKSKY